MVTDAAASGKAVPIVTGALTGVLSFLGLILWFGLPLIPDPDDLPSVLKNEPSPYAATVAPAGPADPGAQTYQTVCAACHQANGQGLPGAFPPLAGSEWVTGDPETMIRIVAAGVTGPIEVKGTTYNSMMPPPPGLDDEKIAAVVTYVRTNFGNQASAVDAAKVAEVRATFAGRATPWTVAELQALRKPGSGDGAAKPEGDAPAAGQAAEKPAGEPAAAPAPQ